MTSGAVLCNHTEHQSVIDTPLMLYDGAYKQNLDDHRISFFLDPEEKVGKTQLVNV